MSSEGRTRTWIRYREIPGAQEIKAVDLRIFYTRLHKFLALLRTCTKYINNNLIDNMKKNIDLMRNYFLWPN